MKKAEMKEKLEKIEIQNKKQYKRQNDYQKENYKRMVVCLKNDEYNELVELVGKDFTISGYLKELIAADIEKRKSAK